MFIRVTCMCQVLRYILLILLKKTVAPFQAILKMGGIHASMKFHKCDLPTGHFILGPTISVCFTLLRRTWQRTNWIPSSYKSVVRLLVFPSPGGLTAGFSLPPAVQTTWGPLTSGNGLFLVPLYN